jgi:hypothetical protein
MIPSITGNTPSKKTLLIAPKPALRSAMDNFKNWSNSNSILSRIARAECLRSSAKPSGRKGYDINVFEGEKRLN